MGKVQVLQLKVKTFSEHYCTTFDIVKHLLRPMSAHLLTCSVLQVSLLVKEGLAASPSCTVVFLLLYFSLLSSAAWWAVLTTSWAVMVFCSLSPATIGARAPLLHALGWGVPAVLTLTCLVRIMKLKIYFISAFDTINN